MAGPAAAAATKAAAAAWRQRGTAGPLLLVPLLFVVSLVGGSLTFLAVAMGAAVSADEVCSAAAPRVDVDGVRRAARQRGATAPASAVLKVLADTAQAAHPDSRDYAGPFRLPAGYAAGTAGGTSRWQGPADPGTPAAGRDSRRDDAAATRAVMRRLQRVDPDRWRELRTAPVPPDAAAATALAATAVALLTAAFDHVTVDPAALSAAIAASGDLDAGAAGDVMSGGVLAIGDPARVGDATAVLGPRAFGGDVRAIGTDPVDVTAGADRDLAAQTGIVLVYAAAAPTAGHRADVRDATGADVLWIVPDGVGPDVYASTAAAAGALAALPGATDPVALCADLLTDPAAAAAAGALPPAVAPDVGAGVAIAYARAQLGKTYSMTAHPPATWDCSKLTAYAWKQAGVVLVAYSYAQWNQTVRVPRTAVAPGDLVFWFGISSSSGGHVALVDAVDADGTIWITEAANPSAGVRHRALGGSWDDAYLRGFGRVTR